MNLKLLLFLPVAYTKVGGQTRKGEEVRGMASPPKALSREATRGEGGGHIVLTPWARPQDSPALGSPIT